MLSTTSILVLSFVVLAGFVNPLYAQQQNQTNMTSTQQQENQTGAMTNATNQTGGGGAGGQQQQQGNQTETGPLEQLGEAIGGVFGGGN